MLPLLPLNCAILSLILCFAIPRGAGCSSHKLVVPILRNSSPAGFTFFFRSTVKATPLPALIGVTNPCGYSGALSFFALLLVCRRFYVFFRFIGEGVKYCSIGCGCLFVCGDLGEFSYVFSGGVKPVIGILSRSDRIS